MARVAEVTVMDRVAEVAKMFTLSPNIRYFVAIYAFYKTFIDNDRVADVGSLSARAKIAIKILVKCVLTIFATNASFFKFTNLT